MSLPALNAYGPHALQLILAFLVGGIIGFEREMHGRPAGLRTHILVCLGAALIAMVDVLIPSSQGKITAQIVTGVGFLGAGAILRGGDGSAVHGLTTAASLWCCAGMGIAIGTGGLSIWMALTAAALVLITLTFVESLERFAIHHRTEREIAIYVHPADTDAALTASSNVIDSIIKTGAGIKGVATEHVEPGSQSWVLRVKLDLSAPVSPESITKSLADNPNVSQAIWVG